MMNFKKLNYEQIIETVLGFLWVIMAITGFSTDHDQAGHTAIIISNMFFIAVMLQGNKTNVEVCSISM